MTDSRSESNPEAVREIVDEALQGLDLEPHETADILGFVNREVPSLLTPESTYFVLGSYRDPFVRRLRVVENELNKRIGVYAFLMGDLPDLDTERLPTFRIRFHLLATYADYLVGVYEQDAGGEVTELGKISETPYFEKAHVLPRDYTWLTARKISSEAELLAAAVAIIENDDLSESETSRELARLVETTTDRGIATTEDELRERVRDRTEQGSDVPSYSWVHLNEFRLFELHDRCYPWSRVENLRDTVENVP